MKLPIETWRLCFSKDDWNHLAAYHHENWEAHGIYYLYWQTATFWFVGHYAYFVQRYKLCNPFMLLLSSTQIYSEDKILKICSQSRSRTFYNYTMVMICYYISFPNNAFTIRLLYISYKTNNLALLLSYMFFLNHFCLTSGETKWKLVYKIGTWEKT